MLLLHQKIYHSNVLLYAANNFRQIVVAMGNGNCRLHRRLAVYMATLVTQTATAVLNRWPNVTTKLFGGIRKHDCSF